MLNHFITLTKLIVKYSCYFKAINYRKILVLFLHALHITVTLITRLFGTWLMHSKIKVNLVIRIFFQNLSYWIIINYQLIVRIIIIGGSM